MSATFAMITGTLAGRPTTRDTKRGGGVVFFKLKVANGNAFDFWDCAVFDAGYRAALDGIPEGFPICATGELTVELWERDGKRGVNLRLKAHTVTRLSSKGQPTLASIYSTKV
jgi:hypothetical protein